MLSGAGSEVGEKETVEFFAIEIGFINVFLSSAVLFPREQLATSPLTADPSEG
jgi:hypothetical protein